MVKFSKFILKKEIYEKFEKLWKASKLSEPLKLDSARVHYL